MRLEFLRGNSFYEKSPKLNPNGEEMTKLWERHGLYSPNVDQLLETALDLIEQDNPLLAHDAAELIINRPINYPYKGEKDVGEILHSQSLTPQEKLLDLVDVRVREDRDKAILSAMDDTYLP